MRKLFYLIVVVSLLVFSVGFASTAQTDAFEPTECFFEMLGGGAPPEDIECGYLTVPEQHTDPDGPTIRLGVAIWPSTSEVPGAPVFFAQGGPGGSSIDVFIGQGVQLPALNDLYETLRAERDLVFIDQRGTLYSEPFLRCTEVNDFIYENIDEDLETEDEIDILTEISDACRQRLTEAGVNLSAYDSIENAADMNLARQALGYDEIVFYGVSYGTLLAQHYIENYGDTLESVILDAVVPTSVDFLATVPANAQRSFDLLFASCAADAECSDVYPNLEDRFYALVDDLNAEPAIVTMVDFLNTSERFEVPFNGDALVEMTFQMLYAEETIGLLPSMITQAEEGNFITVGLLGSFIYFDFSIADGMYSSVVCAEELDNLDMVDISGLNPALQAVFDISSLEDDCAAWDVEPLPDSVDNPVVSSVPALVLSGEFDPITPPENGDIVAQTLSNSFVYTFPGGGHGALLTACGAEIFGQFVADPTNKPDASCIDDLGFSFQ
jgi:pimeloyl-ACP methyl ester carboxylesterase